MQSAKDTFYLTLRDRLAAVNASRTVVVRAAVRPAVVVPENELPPNATELLDTFLLTWLDVTVDAAEPLPLHSMRCQLDYATRGSAELDGMDRGRALDTMDRELRLLLEPSAAPKRTVTADGSTPMQTNVFWSECQWGKAALQDGRLSRSAVLTVCALQEGSDA